MPMLPSPPTPAVLQSILKRAEDVVAVHRATRLVRIFTAGGTHPQRWGSFRYTGPMPHVRFDPHPPTAGGVPADSPSDGVLYLGLSVRAAVTEMYQATSTVDRRARRPHLVVFRPKRTLRLLDLAGLWPTRAGASQEISRGQADLTQAWARTIRAAYPELDGLWYRSSMDAGDPVVCLWDPPASSAIPDAPDVLLALDDPTLDEPLSRMCQELDFVLLD